LTINSSTGVISGTIASTGSNTSPNAVKITATQGSTTATASFTWVVTSSATTALPISLTDSRWVTLPSGVRILDQSVGTGTAAAVNNTINVNYIGYLTNGTIFDQNSTGFTSTLNTTNLIAGWVDGVPGMKPGGVRYLDIPASLAYGSTGQGSIPPNAELVFKITLNSAT
jgi:FKBP-type peptidyl-prolyl cis-trans isomerase